MKRPGDDKTDRARDAVPRERIGHPIRLDAVGPQKGVQAALNWLSINTFKSRSLKVALAGQKGVRIGTLHEHLVNPSSRDAEANGS